MYVLSVSARQKISKPQPAARYSSADGDSIYSVSIGEIEADQDLVGMLAAEVVSEAITRAVVSADGAYGYPAMKDLHP